jgi:sialic acid synthase SpsE
MMNEHTGVAASIAIGSRRVGDGEPPYVLAEMACAHEGDPARVRKLIDLIVPARPDGLQLQLFAADRLVSSRLASYALFERLEIPLGTWGELIAYAVDRGLAVWANVFDEAALEVAVRAGCVAIKLHSTDLENASLLSAAAATGKPISLAVGASSLDEIAFGVRTLRSAGAAGIVLMHGYQAFPTHVEDARLRYLQTLRTAFGCPVGYQDHTDGGDPRAVVLPLVAAGLGACVLEKHFTDERAARGTDFEAALDPGDFARFAELARDLRGALGDGVARDLSAAEQAYRRNMKRSIVAARDIAAGSELTPELMVFLRAGDGLSPRAVPELAGRRVVRDLARHEVIRLADTRITSEDGAADA